MVSTFSQRIIAEIAQKTGASSLPLPSVQLIERVFEINGGSWRSVSKGTAEQIGLLKQVVRGVMSGKVVGPPTLPPKPTASTKFTVDTDAARIGAIRASSASKHHLQAAYEIASVMGLDLQKTASSLRSLVDRVGKTGESVQSLVSLHQLIYASVSLGRQILDDLHRVLAWQDAGGAPHPFDERVAATDPVMKRQFKHAQEAYQGAWDTLIHVRQAWDMLGTDPQEYLRGSVERRISSFFSDEIVKLKEVLGEP